MSNKKMPVSSDFTKRFAYVIEMLKDIHGVKQRGIAKDIGISEAALSDLIKGKSKSAAGSTLKALEIEYGVNKEWLLEQKGEPLIHDGGLPRLNPFLPEEMVELRHMKEILSEKNETIRILTDQVQGLKADKERLIYENDDLKREITTLGKGKTSA
jgi:transcriptional regulator with XRE-family HTH domain